MLQSVRVIVSCGVGQEELYSLVDCRSFVPTENKGGYSPHSTSNTSSTQSHLNRRQFVLESKALDSEEFEGRGLYSPEDVGIYECL